MAGIVIKVYFVSFFGPCPPLAIVGFHMTPKIQTKKLSILPRFYFHDALEQLKTNFHTNSRFKRVLGFVTEYP